MSIYDVNQKSKSTMKHTSENFFIWDLFAIQTYSPKPCFYDMNLSEALSNIHFKIEVFHLLPSHTV